MAYVVTAQNLDQMVKQSDHKKQPHTQDLITDLSQFLTRNPACACSMVQLNIDNKGRKNVFQIRGKLGVKLPQSGKDRLLGFKFVLPVNYPQAAPLIFLDEPEKADAIEFVDYLDKGNRINFDYSLNWAKIANFTGQGATYNLMTLLVKVYNLFIKMPPLGFDELFGVQAQVQEAPKPQVQDQWEDIPKELLNNDPQNQNAFDPGQNDFQNELDQMQDNLDDFDPIEELLKASSGEDAGMNRHQRKSIWKENFKMKNELQSKVEKQQIIDQDLVPEIKGLLQDNIANQRTQQIEEQIKYIDILEDQNKKLKSQKDQYRNKNQELNQVIPLIDEQINLIKAQLSQLDNSEELTAQKIIQDILIPKDNLAEKILKLQCKHDSLQDTLFGLKGVNDIENMQEWLKTVRQVSNKQFKQLYYKQKLQKFQRDAESNEPNDHGQQQQVWNGHPAGQMRQ